VAQVPLVLHEFDGQPVEEFRMGGRFALNAEVLGGAHEALTKKKLPEVIDGDACGERVFGGGEPTREFDPRPAISLFPWGERGENARGHGVPGFIPLSPQENVGGAGLGFFLKHHDLEFLRESLGIGEVGVCKVQGLFEGEVRAVVGEEFFLELTAERFGG
jgi:hypothetical protein